MHLVVQTLGATWSPFVLVAGLLLIGNVASSEGLFRVVGSWCARVPGGGIGLFVVTMITVAAVTAVLNLDTSVVFMTPVALNAARSKGTDETAFLYGAIFMSNSASLLLVGSNLTNLLIFAHRSIVGSDFAAKMVLPWLVAIAVTILVVGAWRIRALCSTPRNVVVSRESLVPGPGVVAVVVAVAAMLVISQPAIWVFAAGIVAQLISHVRRTGTWREGLRAASPEMLVALFVVAVAVGWFARWSSLTRHLLTHASVVATAATSTVSALVINNLPAASLFAAHGVEHPYALLLGLDLGPNCAITGALSSLLWLRIARRHGIRPSILTFSIVGTVVALLSIALGLAVI
ncbi:MAG: SLC13 family permease [Acidimicrobiales bacterium]